MENSCRWHNIDVLLIADSTENIGEENHRLLMNFFVNVLKRIEREDESVHISMAQFTPEAKFEFNFEALSGRVQQNIKVSPSVSGLSIFLILKTPKIWSAIFGGTIFKFLKF